MEKKLFIGLHIQTARQYASFIFSSSNHFLYSGCSLLSCRSCQSHLRSSSFMQRNLRL